VILTMMEPSVQPKSLTVSSLLKMNGEMNTVQITDMSTVNNHSKNVSVKVHGLVMML